VVVFVEAEERWDACGSVRIVELGLSEEA
jgi:hypothetical protein